MTARHRWDARYRRQGLDASSPCGWDDPVPSVQGAGVVPPQPLASHQVECAVQRRLMDEPGLHFSSLVIRRVKDGVCLQGVLEADADSPDLSKLARQVEGVDRVIDQVVVHQAARAAGPGLC
jgi:hypothetical protein